MFINHNDINNEHEWISVESDGVVRVLSSTSLTPEINILSSENSYGRKLLHSINYTERKFSIEFAVSSTTVHDTRDSATRLVNMFSGEFAMKLPNDPGKIYRKAFVSSVITREEISRVAIMVKMDITAFDPFRYSDEEVEHEFTGITGDTSLPIDNEGDYLAVPVTILTGVANEVNLTIGGKTTTYVDLVEGDYIVIDSENYTVLNYRDGQPTLALANWRDNFIDIEPGYNTLKVDGDISTIDIIIKYRNTYL